MGKAREQMSKQKMVTPRNAEAPATLVGQKATLGSSALSSKLPRSW
jgi:hypothetical protein